MTDDFAKQLQELALQAGAAALREQREWYREAVISARNSGLVTEDSAVRFWAVLAKSFYELNASEVVGMLAAAVIEGALSDGETPAATASTSSNYDYRPGQYL